MIYFTLYIYYIYILPGIVVITQKKCSTNNFVFGNTTTNFIRLRDLDVSDVIPIGGFITWSIRMDVLTVCERMYGYHMYLSTCIQNIYHITIQCKFSVFGHYLNVAILYQILQYHYITLNYDVVVLTEIYISLSAIVIVCLSVGQSVCWSVCLLSVYDLFFCVLQSCVILSYLISIIQYISISIRLQVFPASHSRPLWVFKPQRNGQKGQHYDNSAMSIKIPRQPSCCKLFGKLTSPKL